MQTHERHEANLLVVEMEEDDESLAFEGEHFIMWLDDRAEEGRQINVLAHNFNHMTGIF